MSGSCLYCVLRVSGGYLWYVQIMCVVCLDVSERQVRTGKVRTGPVRTGQVGTGQVGTGQVGTS